MVYVTESDSESGESLWMDDQRALLFAANIAEFLRRNLKPGQEADLAIHNEREEVIVFVDGEPILNCTFDDVVAGPGGSPN